LETIIEEIYKNILDGQQGEVETNIQKALGSGLSTKPSWTKE
jgi:hypothetical protein